jgi:hypothetical protein
MFIKTQGDKHFFKIEIEIEIEIETSNINGVNTTWYINMNIDF